MLSCGCLDALSAGIGPRYSRHSLLNCVDQLSRYLDDLLIKRLIDRLLSDRLDWILSHSGHLETRRVINVGQVLLRPGDLVLTQLERWRWLLGWIKAR